MFTPQIPQATGTQQSVPSVWLGQNCMTGKSANNQTTFQTPITPDKAKSLGFNVVHKGNPAHGTILSFGQSHNSHEIWNNPLKSMQVATSQQAILDQLVQFNPKHIFAEGFHEDTPLWLVEQVHQFLRKDFEGYLSGQPLNATQTESLIKWGAAKVYASINSDVNLHGTTTSEFEARNRRALQNLGPERSSKSDYFILIKRERFAMQFTLNFLELKPQQVALIFGASHDFAHCCEREGCQPQFYHRDLSYSETDLQISDPINELMEQRQSELSRAERMLPRMGDLMYSPEEIITGEGLATMDLDTYFNEAKALLKKRREENLQQAASSHPNHIEPDVNNGCCVIS